MTASFVKLPPDSTGKAVDLSQLIDGSGNQVNRQNVSIGSPTVFGNVAEVKGANTAATSADPALVVISRPDTSGSTGLDASANAPAWPNVGANFGSGHPLYPSWALLKTIAANPSRLRLTIDNMSNAQILCLRDDGTAGGGATPVNATGFILNPKVSAGPEGGHYETMSFRGRFQIYGASSSQFVSASTD